MNIKLELLQDETVFGVAGESFEEEAELPHLK